MAGAFVHDLFEVRGPADCGPRHRNRASGSWRRSFAALLVVRPFLRFVTRAGFAAFAWYRIALGVLLFAAMAAGWRVGQWLRRRFITGFFVTVPLVVSVVGPGLDLRYH